MIPDSGFYQSKSQRQYRGSVEGVENAVDSGLGLRRRRVLQGGV